MCAIGRVLLISEGGGTELFPKLRVGRRFNSGSSLSIMIDKHRVTITEEPVFIFDCFLISAK